jgi:hypothetical protein
MAATGGTAFLKGYWCRGVCAVLGTGSTCSADGGYVVAQTSRARCGRPDRHGGGDCHGIYAWVGRRLAALPGWVAARVEHRNCSRSSEATPYERASRRPLRLKRRCTEKPNVSPKP